MPPRIYHQRQTAGDQQTVAAYAQHHEKYAQLQFSPFFTELRRLRNMGHWLPAGRFLEIGSGPGFLTAMMAGNFPQAELNALEPCPEMIAAAKQVMGRSHPANRARFVQGSVEDKALMAGLGKFTLVYSTFSLHHWHEPVRALAAMYRALAKGGAMVVQDLKRVAWLCRLPLRGGLVESIRAAYNRGEIEALLDQADIRERGLRTPFPYFWQTVVITKPA